MARPGLKLHLIGNQFSYQFTASVIVLTEVLPLLVCALLLLMMRSDQLQSSFGNPPHLLPQIFQGGLQSAAVLKVGLEVADHGDFFVQKFDGRLSSKTLSSRQFPL